nr:uncharacterized protein LOC109753231 [Aegilops tauschii subsp. strangulata]
MPNEEQEQYQEGEESGGESMDWQSDGGEEEESEDSSSDEEVESPPRTKKRSKHLHDPASIHGKVAMPTGQTSKRTRTSSPMPTEKAPKQPKVVASKSRKTLPKMKIDVPVTSAAATSVTSTNLYKGKDEETGDGATSKAAPPNVIDLPDDDEEMSQQPLEPRSRTSGRKAPAGKKPQTTSVPGPSTQQSGDIHRASVMFVDLASTRHPLASTAQAFGSTLQLHASDPQAIATDSPALMFATHHVPEDPAAAAREAIRQAGLMMEQMKVVREASQAAYDASSALQTNVQRSCELSTRFADLEKTQIQLNLDLTLAQENLQKAKDEATGMEEKMRQALEQKDRDLEAAQKAAQEKTTLAEKKLASVGKLEEENAKLKAALDEANKESTRLKKDREALTDKASDLVWRRDELEAYLGGLAKKLFVMLEEFCQNFEEETGWIETNLDPINSQVKHEAAMNLNQIPGRVQEWKKSSARCGTDVALSLVRVHCKEVKEEKLTAIKVANTKRLNFQYFLETFIDAATRIADGIDLDEFVEPTSPPAEE